MFISVQRVEEASFSADHLQNPVNPNNLMVLGFYRNYMGTAFTQSYNKKAAPIYWDTVTGKTISRRKWTAEMKSYAEKCATEVPPAPFNFKLTVVGYIFIVAIIAFFAYLTYDSLKPPANPDAIGPTVLMEKMMAGDIYYGRFIEMDTDSRFSKRAGFGWFKVTDADDEIVSISLNKEMSTAHKPSAEMNSTDFESETIPMKIKSQEPYQIDLVSEDGTIEMSFSEKKINHGS